MPGEDTPTEPYDENDRTDDQKEFSRIPDSQYGRPFSSRADRAGRLRPSTEDRTPETSAALTVAEFRIVVQDTLHAVYESSFGLPMVRAIDRSRCEDRLVACYALAARAAVERDQCLAAMSRFEHVVDLLLDAEGDH